MDGLWKLFVEIGRFWQNNDRPEDMKSSFIAFIADRIYLHPSYLNEYKNAAEVIEELVGELGERDGYKKLFTGFSHL